MLADRFGIVRVLCGGAILYAIGLALMAYSTTPADAQSVRRRIHRLRRSPAARSRWCSARFGKLLPREWRSLSFGVGTAAGSFGQFLFSPLAVALIEGFGWQHTLLIFAGVMLLIVPLSLALRRRGTRKQRRARQSKQSLVHALAKRSATAVMCCWCSGSSPAASSCVHHRPSAGLSGRSRPVGRRSAPGLSA